MASQVNALTGAIAQLNQQIQSSSPDADAGTLEDQRQQDLSQLSQLIGINQVTTGEQRPLDHHYLRAVAGLRGFELPADHRHGERGHGFLCGTTDVTSQLAAGGGSLGGYLTARDHDIPNVLASLDQLAYSVSTQVNALNNAGTDLAGDNGHRGPLTSSPAHAGCRAARQR